MEENEQIEQMEQELNNCPECGGELIEEVAPRISGKGKVLDEKPNLFKLQCNFCSYYTMKETPIDKAIRVGAYDEKGIFTGDDYEQ